MQIFKASLHGDLEENYIGVLLECDVLSGGMVCKMNNVSYD